MKRRAFAVCSFSVLVACGGGVDDPSGVDGGAQIPDAAGDVPCTDGTQSMDLTVEWVPSGASSSRLAAYRPGRGALVNGQPMVAMGRPRAGDVTELSLLTVDSIVPVAMLPDTLVSDVTVAAARLGDATPCVVYRNDDGMVGLACTDGTSESSGIEVSAGSLIPATWGDGTLSVFTRTLNSYTELRRSPGGQWTEIEKFESSASGPRDTVVHDGQPATCYVSSVGQANVEYLGMKHLTFNDALRCELAATEAALYILTDTGYAGVSWASLQDPGPVELEPTSVATGTSLLGLEVAEGGDPARAIVLDDDAVIRAVDIDTGARTDLVALTNALPGPTVEWDLERGALHIVTSSLATTLPPEGEPTTQTFRFDTSCLGAE